MGLLLLLLLSSYVERLCLVDAQRLFTIKAVTLDVEPEPDAVRGTNVTLRCRAEVSSSGAEPLLREFSVFKDGNKVYTKSSGSSELLYLLDDARVSNSGKYRCDVIIEGRAVSSESRRLTVRGLSKPVLHVNNGVVMEGEEVTATCKAPGETGSIFFYFYDNENEVHEERANAEQAQAKLRFSTSGIHKIRCDYTVLIPPDADKSDHSNGAIVSVRELSITPVLEVYPPHQVFEGDPLTITCTVRNLPLRPDGAHLYLSQGAHLLSSGTTEVNHSMVALATGATGTAGAALTLECRLEMGHVNKVSTRTVLVTELFSAPSLTLSPAEVFQKEPMTLSCRSDTVASDRLDRKELTYRLHPLDNPLTPTLTGVFSGKAPPFEFNYSCTAEAKGVVKLSPALSVRPRVSVSTPKIWVFGKAVLGQAIQVQCQSDTGSLPINYTLLKGFEEVGTISVKLPAHKAIFSVTVLTPEELGKFMCEAKNSHREAPLSKRLNATVIVPLAQPTLTVLPALPDISEGDDLYLICVVKGSPPVTFKWYRVGEPLPLNTSTTHQNHKDFQIPALTKQHSGTYYCEAGNHAHTVVQSQRVTVQVRMALWKKAVMGGVSLLVASLLVLMACVLYFRSKRVRVEGAAVSVWSERKPDDANEEDEEEEESSTVTNEPDVEYTEVVHPRSVHPTRGTPVRKGTDTVYSELQNSPHGSVGQHDYGSLQYAQLNNEQSETNQYDPDINSLPELPVRLE